MSVYYITVDAQLPSFTDEERVKCVRLYSAHGGTAKRDEVLEQAKLYQQRHGFQLIVRVTETFYP